MSGKTLEQGRLGWAVENERPDDLLAMGTDSGDLLKQFGDSFPKLNLQANPVDVVRILNQGNQGSCQGHALAMMFAICMWLATGRWLAFSRAAGYYLAQKFDGINGDRGSTLNGGRKVATDHGMCLEADWRYPQIYNPSQPAGIKFEYKLKQSKPMKTVEEMRAWMEAGLPIQTGIAWNSSCNQEVVDDWRSGGGGHSTSLWLFNGELVNNINSWGAQWNGDGVHKWTWKTIERMLAHSWTVFIGYAPGEMMYPDQEPKI